MILKWYSKKNSRLQDIVTDHIQTCGHPTISSYHLPYQQINDSKILSNVIYEKGYPS
jgi:hypothetical protein